MNGAFGRVRSRRRPAINITSLIDVMFLLLIFFMVSSTFREHLGIDVTLPQAATGQTQDTLELREIVVTRDGNYYFGQQQVDAAGLRSALESLAASGSEARVVLRADEAAGFGAVVRVLDMVREIGGLELILPTRPQNAEPQPAGP